MMTEHEKANIFQDTLDTVSHQLTGLVEQLTGVEERLSKLVMSQNRPDDEAPEGACSRQPDQARNAHGDGNHSNGNVEPDTLIPIVHLLGTSYPQIN